MVEVTPGRLSYLPPADSRLQQLPDFVRPAPREVLQRECEEIAVSATFSMVLLAAFLTQVGVPTEVALYDWRKTSSHRALPVQRQPAQRGRPAPDQLRRFARCPASRRADKGILVCWRPSLTSGELTANIPKLVCRAPACSLLLTSRFRAIRDVSGAQPVLRSPEDLAHLAIGRGCGCRVLAEPLPAITPDWSPVARFGGYQALHNRVGQGQHVTSAAADSAEQLRWRQRRGQAGPGVPDLRGYPADPLLGCF